MTKESERQRKGHDDPYGEIVSRVAVCLYLVLAVSVCLFIGTGYVQSFAGGSALEGRVTEEGHFVGNNERQTRVSSGLFLLLYSLEKYVSPIALPVAAVALVSMLSLVGWWKWTARERE